MFSKIVGTGLNSIQRRAYGGSPGLSLFEKLIEKAQKQVAQDKKVYLDSERNLQELQQTYKTLAKELQQAEEKEIYRSSSYSRGG